MAKTEERINLNAPYEMSRFHSQHLVTFQEKGFTVELRLPEPEDDLNKAGLVLGGCAVAASITAWGRGSLEVIAVDAQSGENLLVYDREFVTVERLHELLDIAAQEVCALVLL